MNDKNPNIIINFEDGFNISINENELIKNIDLTEQGYTSIFNQIQYPDNLIPASNLINNKNIYSSKTIPISNNTNIKSDVNQDQSNIKSDINQNQSSFEITNMNMPSVYTGEKGGMKGINHEKIEKIIYETTKNSRIFKRREEDLAYLKQEVIALEKKIRKFS